MTVNTMGRSNPHTILVKKYPETPDKIWHWRIDKSTNPSADYNTIAVWHVKYFGTAKRHNK